MHPTLEIYYDPNRLPLPSVVGWLETLGLSAVHRTPEEAPAEWLERYGCCFPWVVANGRIVLKAGFQRAHLERLMQRWYGTPLLVHYPLKKARTEQARTEQMASQRLGFQNLQVYRADEEEDSTLAEILLRSFRSGWRPVIVWVDPAPPPQDHPLWDHSLTDLKASARTPSDEILARALQQLTAHDLILFRNSNGELLLFGLQAWHGSLFGDDQATGLDPSYLMARAEELGLKSMEIKFNACEVIGYSSAELLSAPSTATEPEKDRS